MKNGEYFETGDEEMEDNSTPIADPWEMWAEEIDRGMGNLNLEVNTLRGMVDTNCGVVENFLEDVKVRINDALGDYKMEMHKEFQDTKLQNEEMKVEFLGQLQKSAQEIEENAKINISGMFSSQAMFNGHLWQGLVKTQSDVMAEIAKSQIGKEKIVLKDDLKREILQVCKNEIVSEVEGLLKAWKNWFDEKRDFKIQGILGEEVQQKMEDNKKCLNGIQKELTEFKGLVQQKMPL